MALLGCITAFRADMSGSSIYIKFKANVEPICLSSTFSVKPAAQYVFVFVSALLLLAGCVLHQTEWRIVLWVERCCVSVQVSLVLWPLTAGR